MVVELVGEAVVTVLVEGGCVVVLLVVEVLDVVALLPMVVAGSVVSVVVGEAVVTVVVEGACVVVLLVVEVLDVVALLPVVETV